MDPFLQVLQTLFMDVLTLVLIGPFLDYIIRKQVFL